VTALKLHWNRTEIALVSQSFFIFWRQSIRQRFLLFPPLRFSSICLGIVMMDGGCPRSTFPCVFRSQISVSDENQPLTKEFRDKMINNSNSTWNFCQIVSDCFKLLCPVGDAVWKYPALGLFWISDCLLDEFMCWVYKPTTSCSEEAISLSC